MKGPMRNQHLANWEKRVEILTLKNQGWSVRKIARKFDLSTARIYAILHALEGMTVEDAEAISKQLERTNENSNNRATS
jgi:transcriptional regulator